MKRLPAILLGLVLALLPTRALAVTTITDSMVGTVYNECYHGAPVTPTPEVRDGAKVLELGVDYVLSYAPEDLTNVGVKYVQVKGIRNYTGTVTREYAVTQCPIYSTYNQPIPDQWLVNGQARPKPVIMLGGNVLREGVDYWLDYEDNDFVHNGAYVVVWGEGNFTEKRYIPFNIVGEARPIWRMYNTRTSEHLYTTNVAEYNSCGTGTYKDWRAEGVAWQAPATMTGGAKPVFRLYNLKSGDHHYTTSVGEKDKLLASGDWRDEGMAFYSGGSVPVYRVYNGRLKRGQHHYTTSAVERDALVKNHGWRDEGVGFYAASTDKTIPAG